MNPRLLILLLLLLLIACFSIACSLEPRFQAMPLSRSDGDIFKITLGEGRALFANEFYVKADEYYHSGYYPSIFDNRTAFETPHMAADTGAVNSKNKGDELGFRGAPLDWIDAFGRHFYPNRHTHLDQGGATGDLSDTAEIGEILPWLKLSADLDPHNVQTYVVTAYWLRTKMHEPREALEFLHEGWRHNPDSYEILFELGRLYYEDFHDAKRARNVWQLAVDKFMKQTRDEMKDNRLALERITTRLGTLEEDAGNYPQAIHWFKIAQTASQTPGAIQNLIDETQQKMDGKTNAPAATPMP